jgi:hypothetical protein
MGLSSLLRRALLHVNSFLEITLLLSRNFNVRRIIRGMYYSFLSWSTSRLRGHGTVADGQLMGKEQHTRAFGIGGCD